MFTMFIFRLFQIRFIVYILQIQKCFYSIIFIFVLDCFTFSILFVMRAVVKTSGVGEGGRGVTSYILHSTDVRAE